jgi:hypothetical protein
MEIACWNQTCDAIVSLALTLLLLLPPMLSLRHELLQLGNNRKAAHAERIQLGAMRRQGKDRTFMVIFACFLCAIF